MRKRIILYGLLAVFLMIALPIAGLFISGTISMQTAGFRGEVKATEIIKGSGTFKIQAYNRFHDLCQEVIGFDAKIASLQSFGILDEIDKRALAGLTNMRINSVTKYNADASKDWTAGQFRDNDLPYQLNLNGGNSCGLR